MRKFFIAGFLFFVGFVPFVHAQTAEISSSTLTWTGITGSYNGLYIYDLFDFSASDPGSIAVSVNPASTPYDLVSAGLGVLGGPFWGIVVVDQEAVDGIGSPPSSSGGSYDDDIAWFTSNSISFATTSCDWDGSGCIGSSPPTPPIPVFPDNDATSTPSQTQQNLFNGFVVFWGTLVFVIWFFRKR